MGSPDRFLPGLKVSEIGRQLGPGINYSFGLNLSKRSRTGNMLGFFRSVSCSPGGFARSPDMSEFF